MSNFTRLTKHPITGKFEKADWIDMGRYYDVVFSDGSRFHEDEIKEWKDAFTTY